MHHSRSHNTKVTLLDTAFYVVFVSHAHSVCIPSWCISTEIVPPCTDFPLLSCFATSFCVVWHAGRLQNTPFICQKQIQIQIEIQMQIQNCKWTNTFAQPALCCLNSLFSVPYFRILINPCWCIFVSWTILFYFWAVWHTAKRLFQICCCFTWFSSEILSQNGHRLSYCFLTVFWVICQCERQSKVNPHLSLLSPLLFHVTTMPSRLRIQSFSYSLEMWKRIYNDKNLEVTQNKKRYILSPQDPSNSESYWSIKLYYVE